MRDVKVKKSKSAQLPKTPARARILRAQARTRKRGQLSCDQHPSHPDHSRALPRLRRIIGQMSGIEKMIADRRYCLDILMQFRAVHSAMKGIEEEIFEAHLRGCMTETLSLKSPTSSGSLSVSIEEKVNELTYLFGKSV